MEMLNITKNGPEYWNGICNELYLYEHQTHVPSENDTNTIGKEIFTWINLGNIH